MALTGTADLADSIAAELVDANFVRTAYAAIVAAPKVWHDELSGSLTKSYAMLGQVTASDLTETVDGAEGALTDSQVSATLSEIGIGVKLTDLMRVGSSIPTLVMKIQELLGRGYAKKVDEDVCAGFLSLTDSASSTGNPLTEDLFLQASYEVEANDWAGFPQMAILYPKQAHNLTAAVGGTTENQFAGFNRPEMLDRLGPAIANGYKYTVYGVAVFIKTAVRTKNSNVDSAGAILVVDGQEGAVTTSPIVRTVGMLDGARWDGRLEGQRDTSFRASEAWFTGAYDVAV